MFSYYLFTLKYTNLKINTKMKFCWLPDNVFRVMHGHAGFTFLKSQSMKDNYGKPELLLFLILLFIIIFLWPFFFFSLSQIECLSIMGHPLKQSVLQLIYFILFVYILSDRLCPYLKIAFKYPFFPVQLVFLLSVSQLLFLS